MFRGMSNETAQAILREKVEAALDRLALAEARKEDDGTRIPLDEVSKPRWCNGEHWAFSRSR